MKLLNRPLKATNRVHRRAARGQSLAELAISLAILMMLLSGVIDLGRAFYVAVALDSVISEGAHWAAAFPGCIATADNVTAAPQVPSQCRGTNSILGRMLNENLDLSGLSFVSLAVSPTTANPGDTITLSVSYQISTITPFIQAVFGKYLTVNAQAKEVVRGAGRPERAGNPMTVQSSSVPPVSPVTDAAQVAGGCNSGNATVTWTAVSATGYHVYHDTTLIETITPAGTLGTTVSRTYTVGIGNAWNMSIKAYNDDGLTVTESSPMAFSVGCGAIQPTITVWRCPSGGASFDWTMPTPIDTAVAQYTVYRYSSGLYPRVTVSAPTMTGGFSPFGPGDSTGTYIVQAQSAAGLPLGSNSAPVTISCVDGSGLKGQYFNDPTDGSSYFTNYANTRTDQIIFFNWGGFSPISGVGGTHYSVRWTGSVMPLYSESYNFYTYADDGVRLWVNGQLLIDDWTQHVPLERTGTAIPLIAGQRYDIKLEYFQYGGTATVWLSWSSTSQAKGIIPKIYLYPAP